MSIETIYEVSLQKAKQNGHDIMNRVAMGKDSFVLTKSGKPAVLVVPMNDKGLLEAIENYIDMQAIKKSLQKKEHKRAIPFDALVKKLGIKI